MILVDVIVRRRTPPYVAGVGAVPRVMQVSRSDDEGVTPRTGLVVTVD
jgi:hypothetical protein